MIFADLLYLTRFFYRGPSMDATLRTLKRFDDPSQWEVVEDVPIFSVHRVVKRGADGNPQAIDVTEEDLKAIVAMARKQEKEYGIAPRITQGHMKLPKDTPESQQPPPIGWGRNLRVAKWGPKQKLGILCDQWFEKGKKPQPGDYPYRSVEYYPDTKEITGVALLRRDPELDLGIVTYERGAPCFCYSREDDMADMTPPDVAPKPAATGMEPTAQPDAAAPDPEFQEHFMRCVRHSFPHLERMHGEAAKHYAADAAPASLSPTNGSIPAPPDEEKEAETYMRSKFPQMYSRIQQERGLLNQTVSRLNVMQYKDELHQLRFEEHYPIDIDAELKECEGKTPEQFARYKATLVRHYANQQGPAALQGFTLPISNTGRAPAQLDEARFEKALTYQRDKNCPWEEAQKWALAN